MTLMSASLSQAAPHGLIQDLQKCLTEVSKDSYPTIVNPSNCKKRASVALIIRVRPHPSYWPPTSSAPQVIAGKDGNSHFFEQPWVQHGDPEVLFIKRAARRNDRWTSHVALPGGKRDPDDEDDRATAVRETREEVGLELMDPELAQFIGKLPERIVTTSWGTVPLMVLCPFVFLLLRHDPPPLRLQGTEVSSAHWVSLRTLLLPSLKTYERCYISDRLAKRRHGVTRHFLRATLGQMLFSAIRLIPSESVHDTLALGFSPSSGGHIGPSTLDRPLLLWGLTLGILADFMEVLQPQTAIQLWTYPTFGAPDIRFVLWMMTFLFRQRKVRELEQGNGSEPVAVEEGLDAVSSSAVGTMKASSHHSELGTPRGERQHHGHSSCSSAVGHMLEGYYELVRRAVFVALLARFALGSGFLLILWRWYRRRRRG